MAPNQGNTTRPSSYPGIWKYPSKRNKSENALDWLEGKRIDDDVGDHWRVHDKLYNLESFIKKHPGGSEWIEMTRGTDITEAFESSHVVNVKQVEQVLAKYYVAEAKSPRVSPFTFKKDGFYKTLKRKIEPILKEVGTGPDGTVKAITDGLVIASITLAFLGVTWKSIILLILSGFVLTFATIASHNFFHIKQNWRGYYWDLSLLSSYEWRISHSLSHHLYPNTIMDVEISMFEPTLEFLPKKEKNFIHRHLAFLFTHWVYFSTFFQGFYFSWKKILTGKQKLRPVDALNWVQLLLLIILAQSVWGGFKAWMIIHAASSYLFLLIGLNAAHHHPDIFHDGDEARKDPDFGLCQLDATRDRAGDPHKNFLVIMITFGEHCLHHLFPTVCHSKLRHLKGVFEETLQEFSEQFPAMTQWELYRGCLKQIARTEPKRKIQ
jgi:fatty acid desaturase